jgi:hypothetical protein
MMRAQDRPEFGWAILKTTKAPSEIKSSTASSITFRSNAAVLTLINGRRMSLKVCGSGGRLFFMAL